MKNKFLRMAVRAYLRARPRYFPLGDEISVETAVMQSAHAIDIAGMIAVKDRNVEGMLQAAEYWIKLADFITSMSENKKHSSQSDFPMGFQAGNNEEKEEIDARDDDDRADEGFGFPGLQAQYGKL